jgi:subtilisin-like proprotein convertase family protein
MKRFFRILAVAGGCFALGVAAQASSLVTVNELIPDGNAVGLASSCTISGEQGLISNLEVSLNISGTYNGDLYAYLTHGDGFAVLLNRVGVSATDSLGYRDSGLNVVFDDSAPNIHDYRLTLSGNACQALSGPLTGTWGADGRAVSPFAVTGSEAPTALLSSFDGVDPNGEWTLYVVDAAGGDLNTLVSWGVSYTLAPVPEPGSLALGMLGAGVLMAVRRRRVVR